MKTKRFSFLLATGLTLVIMAFLDGAETAWAWHSPPARYWAGPRFRELPRDYRMLRHGRNAYYFSYGRFYRRGPRGFFLALPPLGLVVPVLPPGFVALTLGGLTYYELNGIYYTRVPEGYQVVESPVDQEPSTAPPAAGIEQRVVVRSEILNVRSGPSLEQEVIAEVTDGKILKVLDKVPGWYCVELEDGERGWVMEKFVAPVRPVPQG